MTPRRLRIHDRNCVRAAEICEYKVVGEVCVCVGIREGKYGERNVAAISVCQKCKISISVDVDGSLQTFGAPLNKGTVRGHACVIRTSSPPPPPPPRPPPEMSVSSRVEKRSKRLRAKRLASHDYILCLGCS